jgi:hypothetical protein
MAQSRGPLRPDGPGESSLIATAKHTASLTASNRRRNQSRRPYPRATSVLARGKPALGRRDCDEASSDAAWASVTKGAASGISRAKDHNREPKPAQAARSPSPSPTLRRRIERAIRKRP